MSEQEHAERVIVELGPQIHDQTHLARILRRLNRGQAKEVYKALKPYLRFKPARFSKLMQEPAERVN